MTKLDLVNRLKALSADTITNIVLSNKYWVMWTPVGYAFMQGQNRNRVFRSESDLLEYYRVLIQQA